MLDLSFFDLIITDFDGVLTNNNVLTDSNGNELVSCSRADGLAFDALRKLNKKVIIISSEQNEVVIRRAEKLKIEAHYGIKNKAKKIQEILTKEKVSILKSIYIGNDLNDFLAIKLFKYSFCPNDSHQLIKNVATYTLKTNGGEGIFRELVEDVFKIDLIELLYMSEK